MIIPGAWYGDYLPTGEYVATIPTGAMQTHLGQVAFPVGESWGLVTPRCTNIGGFRFAGQAHDIVGVTWEYDGSWRDRGPTNGVNGCIYDQQGILHRAGPETSQGYRYVAPDNTLVTGDATYGPRHGLNEYTDLSLAQDGSLLIGQGNPDKGTPEGVLVWDGLRVLALELGPRKFINAHRAGDVVSLAFQRPDGVALVLTTVAALLALPPATLDRKPGPVSTEKPMKNKDQVRDDINELIRFYNEPDGLNRAARGHASPVVFNDPAITDWFTLAVMQPVEDIKRQIRQFPEYKDQHPTEHPQ